MTFNAYEESFYTECRNEVHYAECHYAECRCAECHYAECHGALPPVALAQLGRVVIKFPSGVLYIM